MPGVLPITFIGLRWSLSLSRELTISAKLVASEVQAVLHGARGTGIYMVMPAYLCVLGLSTGPPTCVASALTSENSPFQTEFQPGILLVV